ncbi:MAG: AbiV family abortive infection protein [Nitrososphaerales archaeon]|jgi:hypothetical protein
MATHAEASTAAYRNSKELLEEATVLLQAGKWARSYFLAITSAEQFTRCVEFACQSVGFELKAKRPNEGLHDFGLRRFGLLAISSHAMATEGWNFFAKLSDGKVPTKTYDRRYLQTIMKNFVQDAGRKRNVALYVELKDGQLSDPASITKQNALGMLDVVGPLVSDPPTFLELEGEHLKSDLAMKYAPMLKLGNANDKRTDQQLLKAIGRFLKVPTLGSVTEQERAP